MRDDGEFDFIVSGAGSAGCVLAARLSENGAHRVLLLEAGGEDRGLWLRVPMGFSKLYADPRVNWMFETEPEDELGGRRMYQPKGKVLGGTSSINGMIYIRGHREDYDGWARGGATGWSYEEVLPYFRKAEDQERGGDLYHGVGGPLGVCDQPGRNPLAEAIVGAAEQAGLPRNWDFNGPEQEGAGFYQITSRRRQRSSTSQAYLRPALRRKNLRVLTRAHATKILFDGTRVTGIEYRHDGILCRARARHEVIVAGGTFGSPQLLQLSGVGPAAQLEKLGIPVVRNMPAVGENLRDHFYTSMAFRGRLPISLNDFSRNRPKQVLAALQYLLFKRGTLASTGMHAGIFARSHPALARPDIQINTAIWSVAGRSASGMTMHPFPGFTMSPVYLAPRSTGWVRLGSPDPFVPPMIKHNFFHDRADIQAMIAAMRLVRRIAAQPALAPFVESEISPGAAAANDHQLEEFLRAFGIANFHPVGTCRMGGEAEGVVDSRLRVHGLQALRVVDASIMPSLPAGNTNAPTIMIAEKASDMILKDARVG